MQREKLAIVLSRFPYPLDKGDKLRAYHQIKYLSNYFEIYLYALHTERIAPEFQNELTPYCKQITLYKISSWNILLGVLYSLSHRYPIQVGYFYSSKIKKELQKNISQNSISKVYCQLSRTALYVNDMPIFKVIDLQDAFSTNYLRIQQYTKGIYKLFYQREYKSMKKFEAWMLMNFEYCTIISHFDKEQIATNQDNLHVVPNGVDTVFFQSKKQEKEYDIAFVGNLSYLPNKQAVLYLCEKIIPLLILQFPELKVNIAGVGASDEIFNLANKHIEVSGYVKDIRDVYNNAKTFVAPMQTGAGLQNKLLEAMSMELPCVTTPIVNLSLKAKESEVYVAESPIDFVQQISQLLHSESLRVELGKNARNFVVENYSWEKSNKKLNDILKRI